MLLTVGIYSAWATVRTKRYFYSNTLLKERPFHYDAQPQQLVMGHMLTLVLLIAFIFLIRAGVIEIILLLLLVSLGLAYPWTKIRSARYFAQHTHVYEQP